ncbi:hypothetical protein DITRI_Ditri03aG0057900 [Diplodiscus trichospermus]
MVVGASRGIKVGNVLQAKALALRDGIKLAVEKKYDKGQISKVRLVSRKANKASDGLAVQARKRLSFCEWQMPLPTTLVGILNKDGLLAPP